MLAILDVEHGEKNYMLAISNEEQEENLKYSWSPT